jgi:hypothetical protein
MQWSDISFDPTRSTLRQFAALWLLFFNGLAAWQGFVHDNPFWSAFFLILAWTIGLLGILVPQAMRYIYVGWMVLAFPIGWTVSWIILGLLFFVVFTPVAIVFRWMGRDALALRRRPDLTTFWIPKTTPTDARTYYQQF